MIAIDSNILLRYLVEDDAEQAALATAFIENELSDESPGFVSLVVVAELAWALRRGYGQPWAEIRAMIGELINTPQIVIDQQAVIEQAIALNHDDLADALIHEMGKANGCATTATFDRKFARLAGVQLLKS